MVRGSDPNLITVEIMETPYCGFLTKIRNIEAVSLSVRIGSERVSLR
jgi:hypothetical protein